MTSNLVHRVPTENEPLTKLETHLSDKGHKTKQYAVAICNNNFKKVELKSLINQKNRYIVTNFIEDGDNIRLLINSGKNRSYGDRTTNLHQRPHYQISLMNLMCS